jgi:hypothetical protein
MTQEPSPMPEAVIMAIFNYADVQETMKCHNNSCLSCKLMTERAHAILKELKWDSINGCYFFTVGNCYVGVELDGYVHT